MGESARWRVRTLLVGLVLACLLPGVIGAGVLFAREYALARAQREKDTILTARALVQAVDARWLEARVLAQALATAGALTGKDLAAFHRRARDLLTLSGIGTNVVLSDASGQQLVNTLREYGEPLPRHGNLELHRRVFAAQRAVISDVYMGGVLQRPVLSVDVPVRAGGGEVVYDLSVGILPETFDGILRAQGLPSDWVAAIFDASGTIVARTHAPEKFVGEKGTAEFIQRIRETGEGSMETVTREGIRTLSAYSRSPVTGWSVGIGIPRANLEREFRDTLIVLGAGIVALFAAGVVLAGVLGERLARSVRALVAPALALGSGRSAPLSRFQTRETAEVAIAIAEAAQLISQRTKDVEAASRSLLESEVRFRSTFEQAAVGMALVTLDGHWMQVNERLCEITGYPRRELMRRLFWEDTDPRDLAAEKAAFAQVAAGVIPSYTMEKRQVRANGAAAWVSVSVARVAAAADGGEDYLVVVVEDIGRRKDAEAALVLANESHLHQLEAQVAERTLALVAANRDLERLARQDALTGLQNRMAANERLRAEFVRLKRTGDAYAVLLIDIDHFKRINDTYGHETGDQVLRQVASLLAGALRESDFVSRFGGEEFLAVLPDTGLDGAMKSAEKIRGLVSDCAFAVAGHVTISIGVAMSRATDPNEEEILRRADGSLYRAKHAGRNRVQATEV